MVYMVPGAPVYQSLGFLNWPPEEDLLIPWFQLKVEIDLPVLQDLQPSIELDRISTQQHHCLSPGRKGRLRRHIAEKQNSASKIKRPVNNNSISDWKIHISLKLIHFSGSITFTHLTGVSNTISMSLETRMGGKSSPIPLCPFEFSSKFDSSGMVPLRTRAFLSSWSLGIQITSSSESQRNDDHTRLREMLSSLSPTETSSSASSGFSGLATEPLGLVPKSQKGRKMKFQKSEHG